MEQVIEQYAICDTPGCDNAGQSIRILAEPGTDVTCGVCGQPITAISSTHTPPKTEIPAWLT